MIDRIDIEVSTDNASELLELLRKLPGSAQEAIIQAVDEGSQILIGLAQKERFRGRGPFPVSNRQLGVVTGRLRKALTSSEPKVTGAARVETEMGAPTVPYFGAHEFGTDKQVKVQHHKRRIELQGGGQRVVEVRAHTRQQKTPKRAPLGAALEEHGERVYSETFLERFQRLLDEASA